MEVTLDMVIGEGISEKLGLASERSQALREGLG